jgi:hypothetical protein
MMRMPYRVAATLGGLLLMSGTMAADTTPASNDWRVVRSLPSVPGRHCRDISSDSRTSGAHASFVVCWAGENVWVKASARDTQGGDNRGAAAVIKYFVRLEGERWGHWRIAAFDRRPDATTVVGPARGFYRSRHPISGLLGRACLSERHRPNTVDETTCDEWR